MSAQPGYYADNVAIMWVTCHGMAPTVGSYVATMLATMDLDERLCRMTSWRHSPVLLPMVIAVGLIFNSRRFAVKKKMRRSVQKALNIGNWASIIITATPPIFSTLDLPADDLHMIPIEYNCV